MTKKQERVKKWLKLVHYGDFIFEARGDKHYYFEDKKFPNFFFLGNVPQRNLVFRVTSRYYEVLNFCIDKGQAPACRTCKNCRGTPYGVVCFAKNCRYGININTIGCEDWELAE